MEGLGASPGLEARALSLALQVVQGVELHPRTDQLGQAVAIRGRRSSYADRANAALACCIAARRSDPDGNRWEVFVVLEDAGARGEPDAACCDSAACCETAAAEAGASSGECCPA